MDTVPHQFKCKKLLYGFKANVKKNISLKDGFLKQAAYTMINSDAGYCEVCVVRSSSAALSNKFGLPFLLTFQIGAMQSYVVII